MALLLGYAFVFVPVQELWRDHWLVKDGEQGIAVITKEHWGGHGVVVYRYRVSQKVYAGQDRRSWQNPKYAHAMPGEESIVYFSSSHPWLSAINLPHNVVIEGLPVLLVAWLIEVGLVVTLINPKSSWAFRFIGRQRRFFPTKEAGNLRDANASGTAEEVASGSARPLPQVNGWVWFKDKLWLLGCGLLLVLAMAAIEIVIDTVFGRK